MCVNCRGLSFGRSILGRVVAPLGAPLCAFGLCSCVRVDLLVMMPSLFGGAARGSGVVLCGV